MLPDQEVQRMEADADPAGPVQVGLLRQHQWPGLVVAGPAQQGLVEDLVQSQEVIDAVGVGGFMQDARLARRASSSSLLKAAVSRGCQ